MDCFVAALLAMTRHEYNHYMRKTKLKKTSAFTLLETAIALFVSTIVIVSSLYAFNRAMSLVQTARNMNINIGVLNTLCEEERRQLMSIQPVPINITVPWDDESNRRREVTVDMLIALRRRG